MDMFNSISTFFLICVSLCILYLIIYEIFYNRQKDRVINAVRAAMNTENQVDEEDAWTKAYHELLLLDNDELAHNMIDIGSGEATTDFAITK